ncbi:MAG: hypothetical protein DWQ05_05850 [Calditrichaeota bacterium]|nr:MAG: hypothetical protein DWQ05_05850 [Calditrichota bacterium]
MHFFKLKMCKLSFILLIFQLSAEVCAQQATPFRIVGWHGSVLLHSMHEDRTSAVESEEQNYKQSFLLRNRGFIINPLLWAFQWDGRLGFMQENFVDSRIEQSTRGRLMGQSFSSSFFKDTAHPFRISLNHNTNIIKLAYAGRNEYDIRTYLATFDLLNKALVSRFSAEYRDIQDEWSRGGYSSKRDQVRKNFTYSGTHNGEKYDTRIRAHIFNSDDRLSSDRSYSTYTLKYQTNRTFGDSLKNMWSNSFDALHRTGSRLYTSGRLSQNLDALLLKKVKSSFQYSLNSYKVLGNTSVENSASGRVRYPLTHDIGIGAGLGGAHGTANTGSFNSSNYSGNISYNKNMPLGGMFQATYYQTFAHTSRDINVTERAVVFEEHFFLGSVPVYLNERHIIISSIVVIDKETKMVFEEGENKDYFIRDFGDRVEIHRNLLGRIEESSGILVDYRFETLPSLKYNTTTQLVSTGISYKKLNLYFRKSVHNVDLLAGELDGRATLGNMKVMATGLQSGVRGKKAGISLSGEYKTQESVEFSYDATNFRNTFFIIPTEAITWTASAAYLHMDHRLKEYQIDDLSISSELKWRPTMDLYITSYLTLRNRDESERNEEINFEYGFSLQRLWRIFRLKIEFDKRKWEFDPQRINEKRTTIELERVF